MCKNIDALRTEQEIGGEVDRIRELHGDICSLEKGKIMYRMNEEKLNSMKNEISRNVFKEVFGFDAGCKERGIVEVADGSIVWLERPEAWEATVAGCLTERGSRGVYRQKLYWDTYGKQLAMAVEPLLGKIRVYPEFWKGEQFCATIDQDIFSRFVSTSRKKRT